jgi:hypothetical protein
MPVKSNNKLLRCEITGLEIGTELEDASRYAETMSGRLEIVCEALEAIGLHRRAELMRGWLERWLRIVDVLFEERLQQKATLADSTVNALTVAELQNPDEKVQ